MLFIFGLRLFGSTDRVECRGRDNEKKPLFHVATQFFHINFISLCPCTPYLVLDFTERKGAVKIPLSCKSVCISWLRCLTWLSVFVFGIIAMVSLDSDGSTSSLLMALCFTVTLCVASLVTWHSYSNNASHDRANQLLSHMNLPASMEVVFRRMIDGSFLDSNGSEDELEALALSMLTATGELVNGRVVAETHGPEVGNDLELQETTSTTARPIDDFHCEQNVPTAVAVAQHIRQSSMGVGARMLKMMGLRADAR